MPGSLDNWYQGQPVIALRLTGMFDWWLRGVPVIALLAEAEVEAATHHLSSQIISVAVLLAAGLAERVAV